MKDDFMDEQISRLKIAKIRAENWDDDQGKID